MTAIKELITQFWQGRLNAQDMIQLEQRLKAEEPLLKEELLADYEALLASGKVPEQLLPSASVRVLAALQEQILREAPASPKHTFKLAPVLKWAASIAIIGFAVFVALNQPEFPKSDQAQVNVVQPAGKSYQNDQQKDIRIVLPDASVVRLSPESKLTYQADFGLKVRNVQLSGKAEFKVAKDALRPFTVYAGKITTTALGTQFTVNTRVKNQVQVRLIEGRVVVRAAGPGKFSMHPTFLVPGDQLNVDQLTGALRLKQSQNSRIRDAVHQVLRPENPEVLVFRQESLVSVLSQLQTHYQQAIEFDETELAGLSFTGKVREKDQVKDLLNIVCSMNGLDFTIQEDKIIIRKQKN
jgi:transmembrane sensor